MVSAFTLGLRCCRRIRDAVTHVATAQGAKIAFLVRTRPSTQEVLEKGGFLPYLQQSVSGGYVSQLRCHFGLRNPVTIPSDHLADQYPLVVRLPCHKDHIFDLECIAPWLKLHATCPMDRKNLLKKKEPPPPAKDDEEDGEYDEMFA